MNVAIFKPETIVNEVFSLYENHGENKAGNSNTQLAHMLQVADWAEQEGFEDEVVLAAFFHDIGHLCASKGKAGCTDDFGNEGVERLGADYLRERGFSERLASLVEGNVNARRYLSYKYPEYYNQLSDSVKMYLEIQGGRMGAEEAVNFELDSDAELFIRLRYWDDKAKEVNQPVHDLSHLKLLAISHLYKNN
jgi:predicted HD phosphohydrolase